MDKKGGKPVRVAVSEVSKTVVLQMSDFKGLKTKWQKSGGRLSSTEEIFLDAAQCHMLSQSMARVAELGAEESKVCQKATQLELEELWSKIDFSSYTALSYYEVVALFASQGVSYDQFVGNFQTDMDKKITQMENLANNFEELNSKIQQHIDTVLTTDKQLAGEFQEWQKLM